MDISLLHAGLAAGAALAAVPVILHLFMRQTPRHVVFPALRLVRERQKRSRKRLRIKNWLLLLARMLLVALMALALARPALNSQTPLGESEVPTALALVFDTSLSMQYTDRGRTRLAEAKERAGEVLEKTPTTSHVFVLDSAEAAEPLALSPAAARERIEALELKAANRPLNAAAALAYKAVAASDRPRREVYVLTDLARSAWDREAPVAGRDAAKEAGVATFVLRLAPEAPADVALTEARPDPAAGLTTAGDPVRVSARLRNTGPATRRVAEFYLDGTKRAQAAVDLPADGERDVPFTTPNLDIGLHRGEVRLTGGSDPMAFDDRRFFTFRVHEPQKVLVVSDARIDATFVANALDPATREPGDRRPFVVEPIRTPQLAERLRALKGYGAVALLNVARLDDAAWSQLNGYVREGGGLIVGLGDRVDPANYNGPIAAQVLPGEVGALKAPDGGTTFGRAADYTHPLFRRFPKELDADLTATHAFKYRAVNPVAGARALLSFADGAPALLERAFPGARTGRALMWTTSLSYRKDPGDPAGWTDFPIAGWSFFYLMNQSIPFLAGITAERLDVEAGEDVILPLDPARRAASYLVRGPEDVSERLSPSGSNPTLVVVAPQAIGHWTVVASGAADEQRPALGFSVNPPLAEAQLAALEPGDLDALLGKDRYQLADSPESLRRVVDKVRVGREIFPWLMALILALVTAENYLANKFYRERPAASPQPAAG